MSESRDNDAGTADIIAELAGLGLDCLFRKHDAGSEIIKRAIDEIKLLRSKVQALERRAEERPPFTGAAWDK